MIRKFGCWVPVVVVAALCLWPAVVAPAEEALPPRPQLNLQPDPLHLAVERPRWTLLDRPVGFVEERLMLELEGAGARAESWMHDRGFSLLEEHDPHGRRSYVVMSDNFVRTLPTMRLRVRMGRPQLSAGLRPHGRRPAFGVTIPWSRFTFELEGLKDRWLGYAFVGSARWSNWDRRLQYGVALPVAVGGGPSVGVVLQMGVRFGK